MARQEKPIEGSGPHFFEYYNNPIATTDPGQLDPDFRREIDLDRYRHVGPDGDETVLDVCINSGTIDYERCGITAEYNTKPNKRRLLVGFNDEERPTPPDTYKDIETASSITYPNFSPAGVYEISTPVRETHLPWLFDLKECAVRQLGDSRFEFELRREGIAGKYELQRIVIGNIDLDDIPVYPEYLTLHRFGYGARDTVMDYDPKFRPPSEPLQISHYAYPLGGEGDAADASNDICPEGFGVERAILSWSSAERTELAIDLISFERILPLWQGRIELG